MKTKRRVDYLIVLKHLTFLITCAVFSYIKGTPSIYSVGVYSAGIALGLNPVLSSAALCLSVILVGGEKSILFFLPATVLHIALFGLYKIKEKKLGIECAVYCILSLSLFIITGKDMTLSERIVDSAITSCIALVLFVAGNAICKKGLKYKLGYEEVFTVFISLSLFGLGLSNIISPYLWKGLSVFLILCTSFIYRSTGKSTLVSAVLGLSLAIYYRNVSYVSLYVIIAVAVESLMPLSRFLSAIAVVAVDYAVYSVFGIFGAYSIFNALSVAVGTAVFSAIPGRILNSVKDNISLFKDKQLSRLSINRNRLMTSNRLYDLSAVFLEIADSFNALYQKEESADAIKGSISKTVYSSVCEECSNKNKCLNNCDIAGSIEKIAEIGYAKGKLSLIDIPLELSHCIKISDVIYAVNRTLGEIQESAAERSAKDSGRKILSSGAKGVAEILKGLAFECGTQLKYQSQTEKILSEKLYRSGYKISELLIYGEKDCRSVSMVVTGKEFSVSAIKKITESTVECDLYLAEKCLITDEKCYICFKNSARFDAVFGVASIKKDGSSVSGDTHSVARLGGDKFLVALSDGMGSGRQAEKVSSASLSLIESFYKAGLSSQFILGTVNKLLAINTDEIFTALDVTVIDLKKCTADFVKYGAPYGFIVSENSIRIVEGSSLPMGILEELSPSVVTADLNDGDIVLMMTDGVSDAFGSGSEVLDFLRTLPAKNPQTMVDKLLEKAMSLSDGKNHDDMTALAVRIFERERFYA